MESRKNMMLAFVLLFMAIPAYTQAIDLLANPSSIQYADTLEVPGLSKVEAFARSKQWILGNIEVVKTSFVADEVTKDKIRFSGHINMPQQLKMGASFVRFNAKFSFEDGKSLYIFDDFVFYYYKNGIFQVKSPLEDIKINSWKESMPLDKQAEVRRYIDRFIQKIRVIQGDC